MNPRTKNTLFPILMLVLFLLSGLIGAVAHAQEPAATPGANDIPEEKAVEIAMERLISFHKLQAEALSNYYRIDCQFVSSRGNPRTLWRVFFQPLENVDDPKTYSLDLNSVTGEIVSSGWQLSSDAPKGNALTESDSDLAVNLAMESIQKFYQLPDGALDRYVPDLEFYGESVPIVPAKKSFVIYFLQADAGKPGHYYATVSADTGTVLQVYYSTQEFG